MVARFSFASTDKCDSMVELTAESLTRRSNLTPQRAKNTVNDLHGIPMVTFICYTPISLFSRVQQQATVGSLLRIQVFLPRISTECTEQLTEKKVSP